MKYDSFLTSKKVKIGSLKSRIQANKKRFNKPNVSKESIKMLAASSSFLGKRTVSSSCKEVSGFNIKIQEENKTPITEWIDAENALLATLPKENQKVFFILRNKHSTIRAIRVVHRDIKNAVEACGKENPSLKKEMNARLKSWEKGVFPILKNAEGFLKRELKEQEAFHESDYKHVTKLNDKAYEFSDGKVEKTPVTSEKACRALLNSMDDTEDNLISLLQDILLPKEVIQNRVDRADKK